MRRRFNMEKMAWKLNKHRQRKIVDPNKWWWRWWWRWWWVNNSLKHCVWDWPHFKSETELVKGKWGILQVLFYKSLMLKRLHPGVIFISSAIPFLCVIYFFVSLFCICFYFCRQQLIAYALCYCDPSAFEEMLALRTSNELQVDAFSVILSGLIKITYWKCVTGHFLPLS